jgi:asparagine synthase (glutamine-hydrolysing)
MCGISGIYGLEKITDPRASVSAMNDTLAHRGPNASGIFLQDQVCIGHRRLSIIDLDSGSDQPFLDPSGRFALVFNGEIYNYRQLRERIKNWEFKTQGDTEVLMAAYAEWGIDCLDLFHGMFAFALWDIKKQRLFLARDRMGIKPLYISMNKGSIIFASEMRALLASGLVPAKLDHTSLWSYLQYQAVHGGATMIEGVHMMPPSHYLEIHDNEQELKRYWFPGDKYIAGLDQSNPELVAAKVREKLRTAVERRLVSDVPFGAFLSGGIDSSAIVALMAETSSTQVSTFSVTFAEEEYSEAKYARLIADTYHTAHHEIKLSPKDFLESLPEALNAMDHPSGDGPNSYVVSKVTREAGITMALSGLGGDELFAGYGVFSNAKKLLEMKWLQVYPMFMRRLAALVLRNVKRDAQGAKMAEVLTLPWMDLLHIYPELRKVLIDRDINNLISSKNATFDSAVRMHLTRVPEKWRSWPQISQISWAEMNSYMIDTLLRDTDQMSMAHALEVRVPFLDHELVEYVLGLPDIMKTGQGPKPLLVKAMGDLLPRQIIDRPKMGFTLPWEFWMKGELKGFCETHLKNLGERAIIDKNFVLQMWNSFLKGDKRYTHARIWHLVVLEHWLSKNHVET